MTERDDFFDRLRRDARPLRHEPDDVTVSRLSARVASRMREEAQSGVAAMLARWLRPASASLAALALVTTVGVGWAEQSREPASVDAMLSSTNTVEVTLDGDTYTLAN
jgi:hypothetical protein